MAEPSRLDLSDNLKRMTINDVLKHNAAENGTKTYIIYGDDDREVTYREMNDLANTIGNNLLEFVERVGNENVSVMMKNQLPTLLAFHGILKAGSVYAPIHTDYKGENLRHQLTDSGSDVLIVDDRYIKRLNAIKDDLDNVPHVIVHETDEWSEALDEEFEESSFEGLLVGSAEDPGIEVSWDDIATIIYTSGTTGLPKGVLHTHRQALVLYGSVKATYVSSDDVVHNNLPLFHVGGLHGNILSTLVAGATAVCWDKFSTSEFWNRVEKYEASRAVIFSSMITWLNNQPRTDVDHHNTLNKVTFVPLVDEYAQIAERFGFDIVDTYYGQTEIGLSVAGAVHAATGENATPEAYRRGRSPAEVIERAEAKGIPVVDTAPGSNWAGKPSSPVEVTILNEHDEAVLMGEVGELAARPAEPSMIFEGYVNNPETTVEKWRNLWHHTGDALKCDESGHYYFVDRINDVIRRRGENIATTQIEEPLKKHEFIENVAAFSVPAVDGTEDEVAIAVKLDHRAGLDRDAILELSRERLPKFMIPKYVRIVDHMPTTETAKIEKYKFRDRIVEEEGLA